MSIILPLVQIFYAIIAVFCGITILIRNHSYLGNIFLGVGYLVFSIPGFLLGFSHLLRTELFIMYSVKSMVIASAYGDIFLYFGTKIYFKGHNHFEKPQFYLAFLGASIIHAVVILLPDSVIVLSTEPVNSQLDLRIGVLILAWHFYFCFRSIDNLLQVRHSAIDSKDRVLKLKLNYIILGFILSMAAIIVYSLSNFGESVFYDIIFFVLCLVDLISIWIGLSYRIKITH